MGTFTVQFRFGTLAIVSVATCLACALPGRAIAHEIGALEPLLWRPALRSDEPREQAIADFTEPEPFGRRGSRRWQVHGGYASQPAQTENQIGLAGLGVSYFIVNDLSLDAELNGLFIHQRRDDAFAGNLNLLFRWHAVSEDEWSMYFEAGAGMMVANRRVPHDGSRFNFTPQIGGGFSFDLGHDIRLMTGIRWHHISNANLYADNPGRDSALVYLGLSFGY